MKHSIRSADRSYQPALARIKRRAAWTNETDHAYLRAEPEKAESIDFANSEIFTLVLGEEPVGFVGLNASSIPGLEITELFVDPDHMGRGFGRLLVDQAVATAKATRHKSLFVDANPARLGFYEAVGFSETSGEAFGIAMTLDI